MKKFTALFAVLAILGFGIAVAFALDDVTITRSVTGLTVSTNTFTVRGEIMAIHLDVPATFPATAGVFVATAEATIYTNACASDTLAYPTIKLQNDTGSDLSYYVPMHPQDGTNKVWYVYERPVSAGAVTVKILGSHPYATNSYVFKIMFK